MDFDYLNYVKESQTCKSFVFEISFLTLFECVEKITLDINPIYGQTGLVLMTPKTCDTHRQRQTDEQIEKRTYEFENKIGDIFNQGKISKNQ